MYKQANQSAAVNEAIKPLAIGRGIVISYLVTIPTFIVFSLILTYTDFPEKLISPAVVITTVISIFTAGSSVTRSVKSRGWLNGGVVGLIYMIVLYFFSSLVLGSFGIDRYALTMILIGVLTGAIGGIVGVNMKTGRPRSKR